MSLNSRPRVIKKKKKIKSDQRFSWQVERIVLASQKGKGSKGKDKPLRIDGRWKAVTAISVDVQSGSVAVGHQDGDVRFLDGRTLQVRPSQLCPNGSNRCCCHSLAPFCDRAIQSGPFPFHRCSTGVPRSYATPTPPRTTTRP